MPGQRSFGSTSWSTAEGLPQNTVDSIVQTHDGLLLWIATFGGLERFDGMKSTVFNIREYACPEKFDEALDLGAKAYILKECAVEEVIKAVRAVCSNQNFASQRMRQYLFQRANRAESGGLAALTPTERQVLKLTADYKTSREIGEALYISPLTVKTHRRNIILKPDITGSNALMKYALDHKSRL